MTDQDRLLGCILGTAVGDAVGLRREGLSRRRAGRIYGGAPLRAELVFGRGFCSDDTEHTLMVGRALSVSHGDPDAFARELARLFRRWVVTVPAGVGLATLRACLKLWLGFGPRRSGVFSAGNGPAMRSALLGVWSRDESQLTALVSVSTELTHTDPKATAGALLIARAARDGADPRAWFESVVAELPAGDLRDGMAAALQALQEGATPQEFADRQGWQRGISGYINHTVPVALFCWARYPDDLRAAVEAAVLLGGDTDSVAAITGAVSGANLGAGGVPEDWLEQLAEWPRDVAWMRTLAQSLADGGVAPGMRWGATVLRNVVFAATVLMLGLRRLLPPF